MGRFHRHDGDGHGHTHDHADGVPHTHEHRHVRTSVSSLPEIHVHVHVHLDGVEVVEEEAHEHEHHEDLGDHSGYQTGLERVDVLERIFGENDRKAEANRADFTAHGVCAVNVMSSPGAGKTALLRETLQRLASRVRIGIVEGDIETSLDADRLTGFGAQISLLNTGNGFGGECHLDAPMVRHALEGLTLDDLDLVLIENVGNLVCPAEFEVGEHARAMVFSITEGEEKPLKYPVMFRTVDAVVVNKMDLMPHLNFDLEAFRRNLARVNPDATVIEASVVTGAGIEEWCDWLLAQLATVHRQALAH